MQPHVVEVVEVPKSCMHATLSTHAPPHHHYYLYSCLMCIRESAREVFQSYYLTTDVAPKLLVKYMFKYTGRKPEFPPQELYSRRLLFYLRPGFAAITSSFQTMQSYRFSAMTIVASSGRIKLESLLATRTLWPTNGPQEEKTKAL